MPVDVKPLFRPDALRPSLAAFTVPAAALAARPKLADWVKLLNSAAGKKKKETELLPAYLTDVFAGVLGYVPTPATPYTLKREVLVPADGTYADGALGRFGGEVEHTVAVIEGKGPLDPLDIPHGGRKLSAVDQALKYAVQLQLDWYLVTNLKEVRLYSKQADQRTFERFELAKLADDDGEFARFVFLLGADRLLDPAGAHLSAVLAESAKIGRELTRQFYDEYRALRLHTFDALKQHNPGRDPARLLAATQKILDRVLFVAFAEDRDLLPRGIVERAYAQNPNPFDPQPVWGNFRGLFRAVNGGNVALGVWGYNGHLFADDEFIDTLTVPDSVCKGFKLLADYEYGGNAAAGGELIDVDILGHVFEQSISDLEEMQLAMAGHVPEPKANAKTSRKEAGAFYTPEFVTRYIVAETLGPVLAHRFEALRAAHQDQATKTTRRVLDNPAVFDADALTKPQTTALVAFWVAWREELEGVRIVDPACGSGAFLIEAFEQMFAEYRKAESFLTQLGADAGLFKLSKTILEHNLYGVDLNGAAIEIARLSCWIKTAEHGEKLSRLDGKIVQGNSVVSDPAFSPDAFDWPARFPEVFAAGGFDVVVGNPPYVRQEWIKEIKPHLQQHYKAYDGTADLFVYFYELGLNLLKPGGRLGYIVTNKWLKAGYGGPLRKLYGEAAWVEQVADFGHAKQIFPDADVFPCILVARKPTADPPPAEARVCVIPREQLRIDDLSRQIQAEGFSIPRERLGAEAWNLEPPAVAALMAKLRANGVPLKEFAGVSPFRGVVTGYNDAFCRGPNYPGSVDSGTPIFIRGAEALPPRTRYRPLARRLPRPVDVVHPLALSVAS